MFVARLRTHFRWTRSISHCHSARLGWQNRPCWRSRPSGCEGLSVLPSRWA